MISWRLWSIRMAKDLDYWDMHIPGGDAQSTILQTS